MSIAFILINTDIYKKSKVLALLKNIPEVEKAWLVSGVYDIIAKVKIGTGPPFQDPTCRRIRQLNGVTSTITMKVVG